ncbi:hypothetical protein [Oryzifoliimicrobium ureilyticus]|uniref:hypothetical protein n=1 Tax=Oryzifoliimicrobium ureilyticus TaxID=3113724 RepID=UPI003075F79A
MTINWLDPQPLSNYGMAPTGPGIYVIGNAIDALKPIIPTEEYDDYAANWPDNLHGLYVGISESAGRGIRSRLSCHARSKGNRDIALRLRKREDLWYIASPGAEGADFEVLFLTLFNRASMFTSNVRDELRRSTLRRHRQAEARMKAEGKHIVNWADLPDDYLRG